MSEFELSDRAWIVLEAAAAAEEAGDRDLPIRPLAEQLGIEPHQVTTEVERLCESRYMAGDAVGAGSQPPLRFLRFMEPRLTDKGVRALASHRAGSASDTLSAEGRRAIETYLLDLERAGGPDVLAADADGRAELSAEIGAIQVHMRSPKPKRSVLRAMFASLSRVLEGAGGSGLAAGAEALIRILA